MTRRNGPLLVASVVALLAAGAFVPNAWATTFTATCSTLQSYLNGTNTVNNGDVVQLGTGPSDAVTCTNQSFTVTNTNAFTLQGDGNPATGFNGNESTHRQPILASATDGLKLTITNLLFENAILNNNNGSGPNNGPAIDFNGPSGGGAPDDAVTITGNTFKSSSGGSGGAVYVFTGDGTGPSQPTIIRGNAFSGNFSGLGGALYVDGGAPFQILNNVFTGNTSDGDGGALGLQDFASGFPVSTNPDVISGNTFGGTAMGAGNAAIGFGGGAFVSIQPSQTVTISHNTFTDNAVGCSCSTGSDRNGGGLMLDVQVSPVNGFLAVQSSNTFTGNDVSARPFANSTTRAGGGGEWVTGVTVHSTGDVFMGNQVTISGFPAAEGGGLGILGTDSGNTNPQPATFVGMDDVFLGNSVTPANGWGGAIYTGGPYGNCASSGPCAPSNLTLNDSTITGNTVSSNGGQGGAVYGTSGDSLAVNNSIIFGNGAGGGGSGYAEIFGYGSPTFAFSDVCTAPGSGTPRPGTGNICSSPQLNAKGEETVSSPTIDKGSNALVPSGLTMDFEGNPRVTEGLASSCGAIVDMGAFESPAVAPAPSCAQGPSGPTGPAGLGAPVCQVAPLSSNVAGGTVSVSAVCDQDASILLAGPLAVTDKAKPRGHGAAVAARRRKRKHSRTFWFAHTFAAVHANVRTTVSLKVPSRVLKILGQRRFRRAKTSATIFLYAATHANGTTKTSTVLPKLTGVHKKHRKRRKH